MSPPGGVLCPNGSDTCYGLALTYEDTNGDNSLDLNDTVRLYRYTVHNFGKKDSYVSYDKLLGISSAAEYLSAAYQRPQDEICRTQGEISPNERLNALGWFLPKGFKISGIWDYLASQQDLWEKKSEK